MRHLFFTTESWERNAAWLRPAGLGAALIKRGHSVAYLLDDCEFNREVLRLPVGAERLFVPREGSRIRSRRRAIAGAEVDFVHTINLNRHAFAALLRTNARLVVHWDEIDSLRVGVGPRWVLYRSLERWARQHASIQVVCTSFLQRYFLDEFALSLPYLRHAHSLEHFPDEESPYEGPTFVYMGSLLPQWDHDIVFEAASLLAQDGMKPRFAVLGDGPERLRWSQFIRERGVENVGLLGWKTGNDLWQHLRHATALLFPIRDTLLNRARCPSKTFAYGMARRPIITCRVGDVPQVLGAAATYVSPTPEAFAAAIRSALAGAAPDVEYGTERETWDLRAEQLLTVLTGE